MWKYLYSLLFLFLAANITFGQQYKISGHVFNNDDDEPLSNCNIILKSSNKGTTTNKNGYFEFVLPKGKYTLKFSYIGFSPKEKTILLNSNKNINIYLNPVSYNQKKVVITAQREKALSSNQKIEAYDIKHMPTIYSDVLRSVKILPGVTSNNELSSSYNVRGGNFDENLIYINGFEIYRPFLLRSGVEENQSLLNPYLVKGLKFFSGSFPVNYGDKLSSALDVNYDIDKKGLSAISKLNLFHSSILLSKSTDNFTLALAGRYAYPDLFVNRMQTEGSYNPRFRDLQLFSKIKLNKYHSFETLIITARNKFDLKPDTWKGHFKGEFMLDIKQVEVNYSGKSNYNYDTDLFGFTYKFTPSENFNTQVKFALYNTRESDFKNLEGKVYFSENAYMPEYNKQFLKTRFEKADNSIDLKRKELQIISELQSGNHFLQGGVNFRFNKINNRTDEFFKEEGDSSLQEIPLISKENYNLQIDEYSFFLQDNITLSDYFNFNMGIRFTRNSFTNENLFSPRATLLFYPNDKNELRLSWGTYYQPPFYYEMRNKSYSEQKALKSQKAVHYSFSWQRQLKKKLQLNAELYYKDLYNLIPYSIDQLKLNYGKTNSLEGYAYGFDVLVKGEISSGLNSWIGYSYLNSKERKKGTSDYQRRLLDQTHTLQIFLQDKIKKRKNVQAHVRLLAGSGFLYHPRKAENSSISIDYDSVREFTRFLRVDMGLSSLFKLSNKVNMLVTAEVLNVFNNYNVASYTWYQVFPNSKDLVKVANIYTKRFLNLGIELSFN